MWVKWEKRAVYNDSMFTIADCPFRWRLELPGMYTPFFLEPKMCSYFSLTFTRLLLIRERYYRDISCPWEACGVEDV